MAEITKETLEYLAELGKIRLEEAGEDKMIQDLKNILAYFEELKKVDVRGVEPFAGGSMQGNVFREDLTPKKAGPRDREKLAQQFKKEERGFLKVPAVFE